MERIVHYFLQKQCATDKMYLIPIAIIGYFIFGKKLNHNNNCIFSYNVRSKVVLKWLRKTPNKGSKYFYLAKCVKKSILLLYNAKTFT